MLACGQWTVLLGVDVLSLSHTHTYTRYSLMILVKIKVFMFRLVTSRLAVVATLSIFLLCHSITHDYYLLSVSDVVIEKYKLVRV